MFAVPPATAPELFVSMASSPEVQRAEKVLLGVDAGNLYKRDRLCVHTVRDASGI